MLSDCYLSYARERGTITSSVMISSIIFSMFAFDDVTHERAQGETAQRQYGRMISILNQALKDPSTATHYAIISSISGIMSHHVSLCSPEHLAEVLTFREFVMGSSMEEFDIHERGLNNIIQVRGGFGNDLHGMVARRSHELYVPGLHE